MTYGAFRWPRLLAWGFALSLSVLAPAGVDAADAPVVFRRGNDAEPESLDPHRVGSHWENAVLGDLFLGLTTENAKGEPIPGAAERWTTSPDGLVWTFTLRPGLLWSDGVPLKASDFLFGFRRVLDPKTAARYAFIQYVVKNAEKVNAGKLPVDQIGVRAIDDRTLEITLEAPTPFLPGLLTHYTAYPIPEHLYRKLGDDWVKPGTMVSNGPYTLTEWVPHDHIALTKNPRFYDAAHVAIEVVHFIPIEIDSQAFARYRAGEIDAFLGKTAFPPDDLPIVNRDFPGQAHLVPQLANEYFVANIRKAPFNDARLRRAVSLCVNRELLVDKVYKAGFVTSYAFVPPGIADYHGTAQLDFAGWSMDKRRDEARRLLAEAGYGPKKPLEFEITMMATTRGRRVIVTASAMLKECGIIAHIFLNESKIYYTALQMADFTLGWAAWGADYNDPYTFLYLLDSRAGAYNYQGYKNPIYDRLMDEAQQTQDIDARAEILAKAEQLALDESAVIPLAVSSYRELIRPYVKGYEENATSTHRSRWMSLVKPSS
jgi:oligopeptide transport system substrate-binding protein